MAAEIIIAGISATIQAIDFWLTHRDKFGASRTFESAYPRINTDPSLKAEARALESLVPPEVLDTMQRRVERCWSRYNEVLKDGGFLPQEVDEATEAVKRCICRELERIRSLNGSIPSGTLSRWWEQYCIAKK